MWFLIASNVMVDPQWKMNHSSYLHSSFSRVALAKRKIAKKTCLNQGKRRKMFSDVDIIWSATQSEQLLQQLTSTGFCVQIVPGERGHLLYPNLKLFLDIKIATVTVSGFQPEYISLVPQKVPIS